MNFSSVPLLSVPNKYPPLKVPTSKMLKAAKGSTLIISYFLITLLVLITVPSYSTHLTAWSKNFAPIANEENKIYSTKYVLFWSTEEEEANNFGFPNNGTKLFDKCDVNNCVATSNKTLMPVEDYDAILFHVPTSIYHLKEALPKKRRQDQRYIFVNMETPVRFNGRRTQYVFSSFYNWTMTYRSDSDIPRKHGYVIKQGTNYKPPSREFVKNKTKSIAWIVSNCQTPSNREKLVRELSKYVDIDVYGKCGNLECPRNEDCYKMVEKDYKFYLSFENSYCKDYVTEKLYRALHMNIIPIVYGGANYNMSAPPHSVINVDDFASVQQLAAHLRSLTQDVEKYLQYFKWKRYYRIITDSRMSTCRLCQMLHSDEEPRKEYDDIERWWFDSRYSGCKTEEQLPDIITRNHKNMV